MLTSKLCRDHAYKCIQTAETIPPDRQAGRYGCSLDDDSFAKLDDGTELGRPHCADTYRLDNVQAWLGDAIPEFE